LWVSLPLLFAVGQPKIVSGGNGGPTTILVDGMNLFYKIIQGGLSRAPNGDKEKFITECLLEISDLFPKSDIKLVYKDIYVDHKIISDYKLDTKISLVYLDPVIPISRQLTKQDLKYIENVSYKAYNYNRNNGNNNYWRNSLIHSGTAVFDYQKMLYNDIIAGGPDYINEDNQRVSTFRRNNNTVVGWDFIHGPRIIKSPFHFIKSFDDMYIINHLKDDTVIITNDNYSEFVNIENKYRKDNFQLSQTMLNLCMPFPEYNIRIKDIEGKTTIYDLRERKREDLSDFINKCSKISKSIIKTSDMQNTFKSVGSEYIDVMIPIMNSYNNKSLERYERNWIDYDFSKDVYVYNKMKNILYDTYMVKENYCTEDLFIMEKNEQIIMTEKKIDDCKKTIIEKFAEAINFLNSEISKIPQVTTTNSQNNIKKYTECLDKLKRQTNEISQDMYSIQKYKQYLQKLEDDFDNILYSQNKNLTGNLTIVSNIYTKYSKISRTVFGLLNILDTLLINLESEKKIHDTHKYYENIWTAIKEKIRKIPIESFNANNLALYKIPDMRHLINDIMKFSTHFDKDKKFYFGYLLELCKRYQLKNIIHSKILSSKEYHSAAIVSYYYMQIKSTEVKESIKLVLESTHNKFVEWEKSLKKKRDIYILYENILSIFEIADIEDKKLITFDSPNTYFKYSTPESTKFSFPYLRITSGDPSTVFSIPDILNAEGINLPKIYIKSIPASNEENQYRLYLAAYSLMTYKYMKQYEYTINIFDRKFVKHLVEECMKIHEAMNNHTYIKIPFGSDKLGEYDGRVIDVLESKENLVSKYIYNSDLFLKLNKLDELSNELYEFLLHMFYPGAVRTIPWNLPPEATKISNSYLAKDIQKVLNVMESINDQLPDDIKELPYIPTYENLYAKHGSTMLEYYICGALEKIYGTSDEITLPKIDEKFYEEIYTNINTDYSVQSTGEKVYKTEIEQEELPARMGYLNIYFQNMNTFKHNIKLKENEQISNISLLPYSKLNFHVTINQPTLKRQRSSNNIPDQVLQTKKIALDSLKNLPQQPASNIISTTPVAIFTPRTATFSKTLLSKP